MGNKITFGYYNILITNKIIVTRWWMLILGAVTCVFTRSTHCAHSTWPHFRNFGAWQPELYSSTQTGHSCAAVDIFNKYISVLEFTTIYYAYKICIFFCDAESFIGALLSRLNWRILWRNTKYIIRKSYVFNRHRHNMNANKPISSVHCMHYLMF